MYYITTYDANAPSTYELHIEQISNAFFSALNYTLSTLSFSLTHKKQINIKYIASIHMKYFHKTYTTTTMQLQQVQ